MGSVMVTSFQKQACTKEFKYAVFQASNTFAKKTFLDNIKWKSILHKLLGCEAFNTSF